MLKTIDKMTFEEWIEYYKPQQNEFIASKQPYIMYETYGKELRAVAEVNRTRPLTVWTLSEYDGKTFIQSGFHFVNRLGYFITEIPFEEGEEIEVDY